MDREKVIKGLEQCKKGGSCDGCQYDINSSRCIFLLHEDALALLKEQQTIVQCNDCMWYWKETNQATGYCKLHDGTNCGPDFFCADGKRK